MTSSLGILDVIEARLQLAERLRRIAILATVPAYHELAVHLEIHPEDYAGYVKALRALDVDLEGVIDTACSVEPKDSAIEELGVRHPDASSMGSPNVWRWRFLIPANDAAYVLVAATEENESGSPISFTNRISQDGDVIDVTAHFHRGESRLRVLLRVSGTTGNWNADDGLRVTLELGQAPAMAQELRLREDKGALVGWVDFERITPELLRKAEGCSSIEIERINGAR